MRWMMLLLSIAGFAIAFTTKSPGVMAISIVMIVVGLTGFILGMAARRVANNARDQVYVPTSEEIALIKQRAAQKAQGASSNNGAAKPDWKRSAASSTPVAGAGDYSSNYKTQSDHQFDSSVDGGGADGGGSGGGSD